MRRSSFVAGTVAFATLVMIEAGANADAIFPTLSVFPAGGQIFMDATGTGYTPDGPVFVGAWNGSAWCGDTGIVFSADDSGTFSNRSGAISISNCPCGQTYTVYAYDYSTGVFSNGAAVTDTCPQ